MRKIPVVFVMDYDSELVTPVVKPGCEWVVEGQGVATVKIDGSACLYRDGKLWKRFDRKLNKRAEQLYYAGRLPTEIDESYFREKPLGFEPCEPQPDPVTHHWPGWVPVVESNPADKYHIEALKNPVTTLVEGQTYELIGPTLASNPYELNLHFLIKHGAETVDVLDRSFDGLRQFLDATYIEGLVFHHPDGRMAKIRRKDFKFFWVKEDVRVRKHRKRG